jgi:hypothetical protein
MRDIFACSTCHSIYEIARLRLQPAAPPRCQVCSADFPPSELGDWLAYDRAEPEWTVSEWLTGKPGSWPPLRRPQDALQLRPKIAEPAMPSGRLQKLASFGSARMLDER